MATAGIQKSRRISADRRRSVRRSAQRLRISRRVDFLVDERPTFAYTRDVGRGGMFLRTSRPAAKDATLELSIHLEDGLDPVHIWGRVSRVVHDKLDGGMGVVFLHKDQAEARDTIGEFVLGVLESKALERLKINKRDGRALRELGDIARERDQLERAVAFYEDAVRDETMGGELQVVLAETLRAKATRTGCEEEYRRALRAYEQAEQQGEQDESLVDGRVSCQKALEEIQTARDSQARKAREEEDRQRREQEERQRQLENREAELEKATKELRQAREAVSEAEQQLKRDRGELAEQRQALLSEQHRLAKTRHDEEEAQKQARHEIAKEQRRRERDQEEATQTRAALEAQRQELGERARRLEQEAAQIEEAREALEKESAAFLETQKSLVTEREALESMQQKQRANEKRLRRGTDELEELRQSVEDETQVVAQRSKILSERESALEEAEHDLAAQTAEVTEKSDLFTQARLRAEEELASAREEVRAEAHALAEQRAGLERMRKALEQRAAGLDDDALRGARMAEVREQERGVRRLMREQREQCEKFDGERRELEAQRATLEAERAELERGKARLRARQSECGEAESLLAKREQELEAGLAKLEEERSALEQGRGGRARLDSGSGGTQDHLRSDPLGRPDADSDEVDIHNRETACFYLPDVEAMRAERAPEAEQQGEETPREQPPALPPRSKRKDLRRSELSSTKVKTAAPVEYGEELGSDMDATRVAKLTLGTRLRLLEQQLTSRVMGWATRGAHALPQRLPLEMRSPRTVLAGTMLLAALLLLALVLLVAVRSPRAPAASTTAEEGAGAQEGAGVFEAPPETPVESEQRGHAVHQDRHGVSSAKATPSDPEGSKAPDGVDRTQAQAVGREPSGPAKDAVRKRVRPKRRVKRRPASSTAGPGPGRVTETASDRNGADLGDG